MSSSGVLLMGWTPRSLGSALAVAAAVAAAVSCGGREAGTAVDASGAGDAADAAAPFDAPGDGLASDCVAASGYAICGGTHDCFPPGSRGPSSQCQDCWSNWPGDAGFDTVVCVSSVDPMGPQVGVASDGQVYAQAIVKVLWDPLPFDVGVLLAENGEGSRVRYADWSAWTGEALPSQQTCPQFQDFAICGGNCAPCAVGQICTGRSPKHPYGLCIPYDASSPMQYAGCGASWQWQCPSGDRCVVFEVAPTEQPTADDNGFCLPSATCQAIAGQYPGGAVCH